MAEAAADALRGTCHGLAHLGDEHETLAASSAAYTTRLDELVFECACCGWWCDIDEMSDDPEVCIDCSDQ
ncbi:hypothetical protein [Rhodopseudomonas palustris]|uniref:hypothetical protein n=1 Tax=Rhodopseudomonas palustris TaxID=1076 RepID=UPI000641F4AE|nr:hypothetical protein [Rhodopseudomonas palustris]